MKPIQKVRNGLFSTIICLICALIAYGLFEFALLTIECFGWKWPLAITLTIAGCVLVFYLGDKADTEERKIGDRAVMEAKLIIGDEPSLQQCPCCGHEFEDDDDDDDDFPEDYSPPKKL